MICIQNEILYTHDVLIALGRCLLRPFEAIFRFILASVYMVMVCVCTVSIKGGSALVASVGFKPIVASWVINFSILHQRVCQVQFIGLCKLLLDRAWFRNCLGMCRLQIKYCMLCCLDFSWFAVSPTMGNRLRIVLLSYFIAMLVLPLRVCMCVYVCVHDCSKLCMLIVILSMGFLFASMLLVCIGILFEPNYCSQP
jgi:hypothetical protein